MRFLFPNGGSIFLLMCNAQCWQSRRILYYVVWARPSKGIMCAHNINSPNHTPDLIIRDSLESYYIIDGSLWRIALNAYLQRFKVFCWNSSKFRCGSRSSSSSKSCSQCSLNRTLAHCSSVRKKRVALILLHVISSTAMYSLKRMRAWEIEPGFTILWS